LIIEKGLLAAREKTWLPSKSKHWTVFALFSKTPKHTLSNCFTISPTGF